VIAGLGRKSLERRSSGNGRKRIDGEIRGIEMSYIGRHVGFGRGNEFTEIIGQWIDRELANRKFGFRGRKGSIRCRVEASSSLLEGGAVERRERV
jgi:hypothetical protein